MPKHKRSDMRQHLQTVIDQLEHAQDRLALQGMEYKDAHDEYYDAYCTTIALIEAAQDAVRQLYRAV